MKKLFALLTALCLCAGLCPVSTSAVGSTVRGTCGDDLSWSFDTATGLLSITGTGDMTDFTYIDPAPWNEYIDDITAAELGDGVTSLGWFAFFGCESLKSLSLPDSFASIGLDALYGCNGLERISVGKNNQSYCDVDGVLYSADKKMLVRYPAGKADTEYTVLSTVKSIGEYAFEFSTSLVKITLPDGLKSIGGSAFNGCSALKQINLPDGVVGIGAVAFWGCSSLSSINIPDSLGRIDLLTFTACTSLTSVSIPDGVTDIADGAFYYCTSLTEFTVGDGNQSYCAVDGVLFSKDKTALACYPAGKSDKMYEIPESVTEIKELAFSGCVLLEKVIIPDSVTEITDSVFSYCAALKEVSLPASLTDIGMDAFYSSPLLASITIPASVEYIGSDAFLNCTSLTSVYICSEQVSSAQTLSNIDGGYCDNMLLEYAKSVMLEEGISPTDYISENYTYTEKFTRGDVNYISYSDHRHAWTADATQSDTAKCSVCGAVKDGAATAFGDVNGDGKVNSLDAARILKHDASLIQLDDSQLAVADVNGDGKVNSLDSARILKYIAGIIDTL